MKTKKETYICDDCGVALIIVHPQDENPAFCPICGAEALFHEDSKLIDSDDAIYDEDDLDDDENYFEE